MCDSRKGIAFAGNILADIVKSIDYYPMAGRLANIKNMSISVGGCVPNTAIDLAIIDPDIPISAVGMVGDDDYGNYVLSCMKKHGIDVTGVVVSDTLQTSFTDVMSVASGERTFFHMRGANAKFSPSNIDLSKLNCRILHTGYILLLDAFDEKDEEYGTAMARFLCDAQKVGIKTSVDAVSDSSADYKEKVLPALRFCDYAIMNEIECCAIFGLDPYVDGELELSIVQNAMEKMVESGVREKVIIHCKTHGLCLDAVSREFTVVSSLSIPSNEIKGSVGAGDAFCAGALYGIYRNFHDREMLEFASAAAACNLFAENSVDGMRNFTEIQKVMMRYHRQ